MRGSRRERRRRGPGTRPRGRPNGPPTPRRRRAGVGRCRRGAGAGRPTAPPDRGRRRATGSASAGSVPSAAPGSRRLHVATARHPRSRCCWRRHRRRARPTRRPRARPCRGANDRRGRCGSRPPRAGSTPRRPGGRATTPTRRWRRTPAVIAEVGPARGHATRSGRQGPTSRSRRAEGQSRRPGSGPLASDRRHDHAA